MTIPGESTPVTSATSAVANAPAAAPPITALQSQATAPGVANPTSIFQSLAPLTIKLDRGNYSFWKFQILPALRAHDLEGFILGTKVCPPQFIDNTNGGPVPGEPQQLNVGYALWRRTDQAILSWMLNSISETMFGHVVRCTTSFEVWHTLELLFTTQSKARTLQLRFQLQSLKKGNLSIHDYMLKMTSIAENLSAAGQTISDEDLILYILGGLGHDYDPVVITLTSRPDPITLQEVQFLLQSQEMRLEQLNTSATGDLTSPSANFAAQFRRTVNINGNAGLNVNQGRGYSPRGRGRGRGGRGNRPVCQLCNRVGHVVSKCYHRFDINFQTPTPGSNQSNPNASAGQQASGQGQHAFYSSSSNDAHLDNSWYIDSGATNHITADAQNLQHKVENKGSGYEERASSGNA